MPTYKVTHPTTGKTLRVTGDVPPSEAELDQIFAETGGAPPASRMSDYRQDTPIPKPWGTQSEIDNPLSIPVVEGVRAISNIPSDIKGTAVGLLRAPYDLARLGAGTLEKAALAPLRAMGVTDYRGASEQYPEAVYSAVKGLASEPTEIPRKAVQFASEHPVQTGLLATMPKGASFPDSALSAGRAVKSLPGKAGVAREVLADKLTASAFKPSTGLKAAKREGMIDTLHQYGVTPDATGLGKVSEALDDLRGLQVQLERNAASPANMQVVPTERVTASLDRLRAALADSDLPETARAAVDGYKANLLAQKKPYLNTTDLIGMKRDLQDQLSGVFQAQMKSSRTFRESVIQRAKLAVETETKQILEGLIPGYADVNSEIHKLLNIKPLVEQAVNRAANANPIRLTDMLFGVGGATVAGGPGGFAAAVISRIANTPSTWAKIGNYLAKGGKGVPKFDTQKLLATPPPMKALPPGATPMPSGRPDPSGLLKQDDVIPAVSNDAYEQAWARYATVPPRNVAGLRDLQDVVPKGRPPGGLVEGWNGPVSLKTGAPPAPGTLGGAGQEIGQFGVPQRANMAPINDWSESVGGFPARLERTVPDAQLAPSPIKTGVKPPKVTDWAADAEKANVKFMGMQDIGGGKSVPVFQDGNNKTGVGSFVAQPGETVAQALARAKKRYKETK